MPWELHSHVSVFSTLGSLRWTGSCWWKWSPWGQRRRGTPGLNWSSWTTRSRGSCRGPRRKRGRWTNWTTRNWWQTGLQRWYRKYANIYQVKNDMEAKTDTIYSVTSGGVAHAHCSTSPAVVGLKAYRPSWVSPAWNSRWILQGVLFAPTEWLASGWITNHFSPPSIRRETMLSTFVIFSFGRFLVC